MSVRSIVGHLSPRAVVASVIGALVLLAALLVPDGARSELARAVSALPSAQPFPVCLGGAMFAVSQLCSAGAWRTLVQRCGGWMDLGDAAASYGAGSLASSLLPAGAGDVVRITLFSRPLAREGRLWTMGGILLALSVMRAGVLLVLVLGAAAFGELPLWPVAVLGGVVVVAGAVIVRFRRDRPQSRAAHLLDAFAALGRSPRTSCVLGAWTAGSIAARVAAATAVAAAFGVPSPLLAGLVIVPALELAGALPLTPANLGLADGAMAAALRASGSHLTSSLTIAIGLHAVETLTSIAFGSWGVLHLVGARVQWARRLSILLAGAAGLAAAVITGTFLA